MEAPAAPRWTTLPAVERRVLGVLIEKAKTTPDAYPMTLNSARTGCNQKSNRSPQMELDEEQVFDALTSLRKRGVVSLIEGSGRVDKFRHLAYEWLAVDKHGLAVMAELLLRGAQTMGELRTRASRMESIRDQDALRPIIEALRTANLLVFIARPGRAGLVTHNLYEPQELERICRDEGGTVRQGAAADDIDDAPASAAPSSGAGHSSAPPSAPMRPTHQAEPENDGLRELLRELQTQVDELRGRVEDLEQQVRG
ncbi:hypothetical protein Pla175_02150 [Pirellulimonas nuda]|uniref:DUF480 domain-containing protein n=1 Tax=Pirellulimonas nuda TaxID=2528009 RepID=A0A518D5W3_9BACT|nr:DUF480 domain-containing protein [Pirellulimonas nuda]QDU86862.1 hypothetical protein Pla175_02150 [Pirellulimonas nuda]